MFSCCQYDHKNYNANALSSITRLVEKFPKSKDAVDSNKLSPPVKRAFASNVSNSSSSPHLTNSSDARPPIRVGATMAHNLNASVNTVTSVATNEGKGISSRSRSTSLSLSGVPNSINPHHTPTRSSTLTIPQASLRAISAKNSNEGKGMLRVEDITALPNSLNNTDAEIKPAAFSCGPSEDKLEMSVSLNASRTEVKDTSVYFRKLQEQNPKGWVHFAKWLTQKILVTPKGRTSRFYHFEKEVLDNLNEKEIRFLRNDLAVLDNLSVQNTARRDFSIKIIRLLVEEGQKYKFLARFIGQGEPSLEPADKSAIVLNSYAASDEWNKILKGPVLEKIAEQADEIRQLDLRAPFTQSLIDKAIALNLDAGLALLCRSCSNVTAEVQSYPFDDLTISRIALRFGDPNKSPVSIAFSSSLWKPVHNYLKAHPVSGRDMAMEWFIAAMNLGAYYNLNEALLLSGYTFDDLTDEVRKKITCLKLDGRSENSMTFISSFGQLQELWIEKEKIEKFPLNCQRLKHLTVRAESITLPSEMSELVHLNITCKNAATLSESLPKLKSFVCEGGAYERFPSMPKVTVIELRNTDIALLPHIPELRRLIVCNNRLLKEVLEIPKAEVIWLESCPELSRFFASPDSQYGIPKFKKLPETLVYFDVKDVGNSSIRHFCEAWNKKWINGKPQVVAQILTTPISVEDCA